MGGADPPAEPMRCHACQADNPRHARFCIACGSRLASACASCGAELPEGARFCPGCGRAVAAAPAPAPPRPRAPEVYTPRHLAERILTSRAALEGERKPVTVLFCDLVRSTELAERLGPDAMHDLLNRFFEQALAEVHRYEGTVNQFLGDGFMALFGAPLAHEDHARRAALAALGVARAVGGRPLVLESGEEVALGVRMGLHTGLVVVGAIGDNLRMDYTAIGDTTHLAARLQQAAPPGAILASEATARLIEGQVALEAAGALELRGLRGAVRAYRLVGPGAPASPALGRRTQSPFQGREREVSSLLDLFAEAEQGQGHVVGIVGEPGLGKSRLVFELRRQVGDRATCIEGRCLSYASAIPYLPVLDLVRGACGIAEIDPPDRAAEKVRAALEAADMDAAERAPYLLRLLGLKPDDDAPSLLDGEALIARTLDTLRQLWLRMSRKRPLLLVVEDLHWVDPASEAVLGALAERVGGARVMMVGTYRPGYRPPWIDRSYAVQIALGPLRRDASVGILRSLRPELGPADPRATLILDRAEGNPFFLEELVHVMDGAEAGRVAVPDSVQGVLAARIDRLTDSAKQVLLTASVLGREFPERLLRAIVDAPATFEADLRELTRCEFLHDRSDTGERAWIFKHALTHEVARAMLVAGRRRALHRRAAEAIAATAPDRLAELAPVLAHHYLEAEAWAEAAEHARLAAEAAHRRWANREALARYDQAVAAAERAGLPSAARRALLAARAGVHAALGRFEPARADLEAALALAREDGDIVGQGRLLTALAAQWGGHKDYALGLALTREAVDLLEVAGDRRALANARAQLGVMLMNVVRMADSRRELEQSLALFEALGDELGQGRTHEMLGMNLWLSGDVPRAIASIDQALPRLRAAGDRRAEISALMTRGAALAWTESLCAGLPPLEAALDIALALEARSDEAFVRCCIADFGMVSGAYALAHREAPVALAIARDLGHREWTAYALGVLGRLYTDCGNPAAARPLHDEELAVARELGAPVWIADALANVGHDLLAMNQLDAAAPYLEEALDAAGECAEKLVYPLLDLAELALRSGRHDEAIALIERLRASSAGGFGMLLIPARAIEGEALLPLGRRSDALAALTAAAREAERGSARPTRWRAGLALAQALLDEGREAEGRRHAAAVVALLDEAIAELPAELSGSFAASDLVSRARSLAGHS